MNSLWDILSVAIGISFIFMILSILNSWIQDYIATVFDLRAKNLADIMQNLLEPGAQELNGNKRARTVFKSEIEIPQGQFLRWLPGRRAEAQKRGCEEAGRGINRRCKRWERRLINWGIPPRRSFNKPWRPSHKWIRT